MIHYNETVPILKCCCLTAVEPTVVGTAASVAVATAGVLDNNLLGIEDADWVLPVIIIDDDDDDKPSRRLRHCRDSAAVRRARPGSCLSGNRSCERTVTWGDPMLRARLLRRKLTTSSADVAAAPAGVVATVPCLPGDVDGDRSAAAGGGGCCWGCEARKQ